METEKLLTGKHYRDLGIQQALDNANDKHVKWSDIAYEYLLKYIKQHPVFMVEDVRTSSIEEVPVPPCNRAWGGIIVRAANKGLVTRIGYRSVKNPKAHCTTCTLWEVVQ